MLQKVSGGSGLPAGGWRRAVKRGWEGWYGRKPVLRRQVPFSYVAANTSPRDCTEQLLP